MTKLPKDLSIRGVHPKQKVLSRHTPTGRGRFPNFKNHGGPVIRTPQLYILFVGDWSSAASQNRATRLRQFTTDLLKSRYMNILSQYGCGANGNVINSVFVTSPAQELGGPELNNILQTAINNNQIPEPVTNADGSLSGAYVLFLDDNIEVNDEVDPNDPIIICEPANDNAFGFHDSFVTVAGNLCAFAVVPGLTDSCLQNACHGDPSCSIHPGMTQEQRQTQVASHELAEMFSDPEPQNNPAWTDVSKGGGGENGDICNGQSATITVGPNTWTVQRMYSKRDDMNSNGATLCLVDPPNPVQPPPA